MLDKTDLLIKIENLTTAQAVALRKMLMDMEYLGVTGSSRYLAFMADGDGNFRPKVTVAVSSGSPPLPDLTHAEYNPLGKLEVRIRAHIYDQQHLAGLLD